MVVTRVCPNCQGYGEVYLNDSYYRDPQCAYPVMCGTCNGIGEVEEEEDE